MLDIPNPRIVFSGRMSDCEGPSPGELKHWPLLPEAEAEAEGEGKAGR